MFQPKPISKDSIPVALEKAERYRLLNEPWLAESICFDILEADPQNMRAVIILLLAITDQFHTSSMAEVNKAKQLLSRLSDEYEKQYYSGIICERQAKSTLTKNIPDGGFKAYELLRDAMEYYEKAETLRQPGNDDAILRWNTCVRLITRHRLEPRNEKHMEQPLE